jgi:macrolide-specific efflux system membrane fusion protein
MTSAVEIPVGVQDKVPVGRPTRPHSRFSRLGRPALILAACALFAGGGYYAWQTWFAQDGSAAGPLTTAATRGNLEDTVTATGTLQPKDYVDVGTQVSGQLKKLLVDIGAVVKAKDLLAEIDPSVYQAKVDGDQAQLLNQQAQLADKQAQLALADLQLARQQNLMREEATTADVLQIAEATRKSALAQLDSIKAQIQQTASTLRGDEANLGYTKIYAPIAGTVVSQAAKQGQTLNANQQAPIIMRIADLSTMTVEAQVSEADVPKLHLGMDVYFTTLGGNNRRFYGKLRQIPPTPTVVNNVVLYDALFDVANPDQVLMTQMTAQVFFVVASAKDAVLVPLTALRPVALEGRPSGSRVSAAAGADGTGAARSGGAGTPPGAARSNGAQGASGGDRRNQFAGGRALVSVVDADGKVADREVKVGVMNRVSAQIVAGLEPGERVVIGTRLSVQASPAQTGSSLVPSAAKAGGRP